MPAEGRENPLLKKGNSDAFFREKYLTKKHFIEHTIVHRDIRRLEIEAEEGILSSSYILHGYNAFFAD